MKKICLVFFVFFCFVKTMGQVYTIDFGSTIANYMCNPPVYTTTGQSQCIDDVTFLTPTGTVRVYTTTEGGSVGEDCRKSVRLENPGKNFIGSESELQIRNAGNGVLVYNPARFTVKDFPAGLRFGIIFDVAIAGYGGTYYFRCGNGRAYGDTTYMLGRDSSSFIVLRFNDDDPSIQPFLQYCNSASNLSWPNIPFYYWASGVGSNNFARYQRHTIAIFGNNSAVPVSYNYIGTRTLAPSTYEVYIDSVLDASMYDNFFQNGRAINSFMFGGESARCASGGLYLGDTLIVDNIRWTSDFVSHSLPVHISSFTGAYENGSMHLRWRDETPADGVRVEVQGSSDGITFRSLGTRIEQSAQRDYSFGYPEAKCGRYFFRLFAEGKYSNVISVSVPCAQTTITYADRILHVDALHPGVIKVINMLGEVVLEQQVPLGRSTIALRASAGAYVAQYRDAQTGETVIKKFIQ